MMKGFASDNCSGAHPAVLERLTRVNAAHVTSYGDDLHTEAAIKTLQKHLGTDASIRFVFNGTAANVLCLSTLLEPWESVICASDAHINTDECGAPEYLAGIKLITLPTPDGKLTPELIASALDTHEHARQPRVVSISNVTEVGTIYTPEEVKTLAEYVHSRGLYLHCDGARIANAAATQGVSIAALTVDAGMDALSFGATKNACLYAEASVWFGNVARDASTMSEERSWFLRKASAMLGSKMRYMSAQFSAMYEGDLWLECASQANAMARRLVAGLPSSVKLAYEPGANEVFAYLPKDSIESLQERFYFYTWDEETGCVRWVCSWDTTPEEVDALLAAIHQSCPA